MQAPQQCTPCKLALQLSHAALLAGMLVVSKRKGRLLARSGGASTLPAAHAKQIEKPSRMSAATQREAQSEHASRLCLRGTVKRLLVLQAKPGQARLVPLKRGHDEIAHANNAVGQLTIGN